MRRRLLFRHASLSLVVAFLVVIPEGDLLLFGIAPINIRIC